MSLLLDSPVAAPAATASRRRSLLPVLAAVVAVAGIGLSALLMAAPSAASFPKVQPIATGAPFVTVPEYGVRGAYIFGYEHGAHVAVTVPVRNDGWLPVTVRSAVLDDGPAPLLSITGVEGLPLKLGAGESGRLVLRGTFINCRYYHERALETYDGVTLGFSSLGRSGSRLASFDRPLLVKSPMLASCPNRLLDRQADRRNPIG